MKRAVVIGIGVVLVVGLLVAFGLPLVNRRCQEWYHRVDFVADRRFEQILGHRPRQDDYERFERIIDRTRAEAIEEIGAKPFHCG